MAYILFWKQGNSRKTSTTDSLTMLKPLTVWITTNWKIIKEMGIPDHLTSLLRNLYAGQEATCQQQTGSKLGKEYVKAVYCHLAHLTYMQSTSCEIPGWMNHKWLESRLRGEISVTSDMQITPAAWGWCTGTTQRDGTGREEGGGSRMGNTCIPVADSCWYMAKPIQYCKVKKKKRISLPANT